MRMQRVVGQDVDEPEGCALHNWTVALDALDAPVVIFVTRVPVAETRHLKHTLVALGKEATVAVLNVVRMKICLG